MAVRRGEGDEGGVDPEDDLVDEVHDEGEAGQRVEGLPGEESVDEAWVMTRGRNQSPYLKQMITL